MESTFIVTKISQKWGCHLTRVYANRKSFIRALKEELGYWQDTIGNMNKPRLTVCNDISCTSCELELREVWKVMLDDDAKTIRELYPSTSTTSSTSSTPQTSQADEMDFQAFKRECLETSFDVPVSDDELDDMMDRVIEKNHELIYAEASEGWASVVRTADSKIWGAEGH
jgi:hypothetical protein